MYILRQHIDEHTLAEAFIEGRAIKVTFNLKNSNVARRYLNFLIHSSFRGGETVYAFNNTRTGVRVIVRIRDGREIGEDNEYVLIQGNEEMARDASNAY